MWSAVCVVFWALAESSSRWENACLCRGSHIVCVWLAPHCTVIDKAKFILKGGGGSFDALITSTQSLFSFSCLENWLRQHNVFLDSHSFSLRQLCIFYSLHMTGKTRSVQRGAFIKRDYQATQMTSMWTSAEISYTQTNKHTVLWKFHLWSHFFIFFFKEVRFSWNVF